MLIDQDRDIVGRVQIDGTVKFHLVSSFELGLVLRPNLTASWKSLLDDYQEYF